MFDRASYDRLVETEGAAAAQDALSRLAALIDGFHADEAAVEGKSAALAELARRLGVLDLAKAHEELISLLDGSALKVAVLRCRVARDLAQRVFHELKAGTPESASRVALL